MQDFISVGLRTVKGMLSLLHTYKLKVGRNELWSAASFYKNYYSHYNPTFFALLVDIAEYVDL